MTRFVEIKAGDGQIHHVNPDQVAYIVPAVGGTRSRLVFGAVQGGLHELTTTLPPDELLERLERDPSRVERALHALQDRLVIQEALTPIFGPPVGLGDLVASTQAASPPKTPKRR